MATPLYEQLYTFVLDEIKAGRLKSGDRVPSEKELAERFNVSRITSKKALETLVYQGVISRARGKGSFVSTKVPDAAPLPQTSDSPPATSDPHLLGLVLPDFSDAYGAKLLHALEERAATRNCLLAIKVTNGLRDQEEAAIRAFRQLGVDGLIVFPVHGEYYNADLLRLTLDNFPLVLVDRHLKGIPACAVYTDNVKAATDLTNYLLDRNHTTIAFVSPPAENTSTIEERVQGYNAALTGRGYTVHPDYVFTHMYSTLPKAFQADHIHEDEATLRAFITAHPNISAFVASEFNVARILARVLNGSDKEIVCFDSPDDPFDEYRFVHIQQDETAMGHVAVDLLLDQLAGRDVPLRTVVDFRLVATTRTTALSVK